MKALILLATYNGENYIKDQMLSIISQNKVEIDIIVADDASTDSTLQIIHDHFPNVPVTINSPGTGSAANNFLKMVSNVDFDDRAGYVAFSDQDDIWLPDKMCRAIEMLQINQAELYCSNLTKWNTSNNSYSILKKDFPQKRYDFLFEGGSAGCTYVFTIKFAKLLQEFLKRVDSSDWKGFSHDWLIYFFARSANLKVYIDANSYIHYRLHTENVHGHLNKLSYATIKEKSKQVFEGYYQNHVKNYIKYIENDTEEYKIYRKFLGNYFQRNGVIFKYNTELMRDRNKFLVFAVLNLLKFR